MSIVNFSPSENLLKSISSIFAKPYIFVIPTLELENTEELERHASYIRIFQLIFKENFGERFTKEHSQGLIVHMLHERLRNAFEHGNKFDSSKQVIVGLWLGVKGALFAFRDEGDYFSLQKTKEIYESRSSVKTTRKDASGQDAWGGTGTKRLYQRAKEIFVSTEENTLYASYLL